MLALIVAWHLMGVVATIVLLSIMLLLVHGVFLHTRVGALLFCSAA